MTMFIFAGKELKKKYDLVVCSCS